MRGLPLLREDFTNSRIEDLKKMRIGNHVGDLTEDRGFRYKNEEFGKINTHCLNAS